MEKNLGKKPALGIANSTPSTFYTPSSPFLKFRVA